MAEQPARILVVDDEDASRELMLEALRRAGYRLTGADGGEAALELMDKTAFDLVVTDVQMGGMSGLELVRAIREAHPETLVVVVTAFGDSAVTIEAIRAGAFDFILKPFQVDKLRQVVANALAKHERIARTDATETVPSAKSTANKLIGRSDSMIELFKLIGRVANTESTVLIIGESGTGKELVAKAIHENSYRRDKPFVAINCGALTEPLLESDLFGYERGAFTGAEKTHLGIFEAVNGGTCLLDEIGEMPLSVQPKLLRVLQDGEIRRVGSNRSIQVDVRLLAATNRQLEEMVEARQFREDLYYRLNVVHLEIPPLRERPEDIPLLVEHFLAAPMARHRRRGLHLAPEVLPALKSFSWPGNVRELENVIESAAPLAPTSLIPLDSLPARVRSRDREAHFLERELPGALPTELLPLAEVERLYILKVLKDVKGNKSRAARVRGLDRKTLRLKLKQYGQGDADED